MTKSEFIDWKRSPVTQEVFKLFRERTAELTEQLIEQSIYGDPRKQAETAAAIKVYREVLDMSFEGESHGD